MLLEYSSIKEPFFSFGQHQKNANNLFEDQHCLLTNKNVALFLHWSGTI